MNTLKEQDLATLRAWVDDELPEDERARFADRLAHEPALAAALAGEQALKARLVDAFADLLDEPVPDRIATLLSPGEAANDARAPGAAAVVSLADARRRADAGVEGRVARATAPARWIEWGGLAASLVLGLVLGRWWSADPAAPGAVASPVAFGTRDVGHLVARSALAHALDDAVGGQAVDGTKVALSFPSRDGRLCRSFRTGADVASVGIACRSGGAWAIEWLERTGGAPSGADASAYRTAGSELPPSLVTAIEAMRGGDTLDAEAEVAARAKDWQPNAQDAGSGRRP